MIPGVPCELLVFTMEWPVPATPVTLLERKACVFHPALVEVNVEAIGGAHPDELWNQLGQGTKCFFALVQRLFRPLALSPVAQGDDAIAKIVSQFPEKMLFGGVKGSL